MSDRFRRLLFGIAIGIAMLLVAIWAARSGS